MRVSGKKRNSNLPGVKGGRPDDGGQDSWTTTGGEYREERKRGKTVRPAEGRTDREKGGEVRWGSKKKKAGRRGRQITLSRGDKGLRRKKEKTRSGERGFTTELF